MAVREQACQDLPRRALTRPSDLLRCQAYVFFTAPLKLGPSPQLSVHIANAGSASARMVAVETFPVTVHGNVTGLLFTCQQNMLEDTRRHKSLRARKRYSFETPSFTGEAPPGADDPQRLLMATSAIPRVLNSTFPSFSIFYFFLRAYKTPGISGMTNCLSYGS